MELFGYANEPYVPHIDSFSVRLHPDDRAKTEAAIKRAIESLGDYEADYRVVHPDGTVRWVAARGRVLADRDGTPARMLGAAYDTTDVHSAAERLGRVLETMSTAFFTIDRAWRFTYVNAAAERTLGRGRDELVGQRHLGALQRPRRHRERPPLPRRDDDRASRRASSSSTPPLDAYFDVRVTPSDDGISVYFHDITRGVRAEQEREAALEQTGAATGRLQILSAASARLAGTLEVDELLRILSDVVLNGFGEGLVLAIEAGAGLEIALAAHLEDARRATPCARGCWASGSRSSASARGPRWSASCSPRSPATRWPRRPRSRCRWSRAGARWARRS